MMVKDDTNRVLRYSCGKVGSGVLIAMIVLGKKNDSAGKQNFK